MINFIIYELFILVTFVIYGFITFRHKEEQTIDEMLGLSDKPSKQKAELIKFVANYLFLASSMACIHFDILPVLSNIVFLKSAFYGLKIAITFSFGLVVGLIALIKKMNKQECIAILQAIFGVFVAACFSIASGYVLVVSILDAGRYLIEYFF